MERNGNDNGNGNAYSCSPIYSANFELRCSSYELNDYTPTSYARGSSHSSPSYARDTSPGGTYVWVRRREVVAVRSAIAGQGNIFFNPYRYVRVPVSEVQSTPEAPAVQDSEMPALLADRITMQDAFGTHDGPCTFRALLGIAETRARQNLTYDQLIEARDRFYRQLPVSRGDWFVSSELGGHLGVINIGFDLLRHDEEAVSLRDSIYTSSGLPIPPHTQATMLRVPGPHMAEGDARGNLVWDPLGVDTFGDTPIDRINVFGFVPYQRRGYR